MSPLSTVMFSASDIMLDPLRAITVFVKVPATETVTSLPAAGDAGRVIVCPAAVTKQRSLTASVLDVLVVVAE